jgi:hypothetical protein
VTLPFLGGRWLTAFLLQSAKIGGEQIEHHRQIAEHLAVAPAVDYRRDQPILSRPFKQMSRRDFLPSIRLELRLASVRKMWIHGFCSYRLVCDRLP